MTEVWANPLLVIAVPVLGAASGLVLWARPKALKLWLLLVTFGSLLPLAGIAEQQTEPAEGLLFLSLLPLAAFLSLLGQPPHPKNRMAWLATVLLLGLGLGVLVSRDSPGQILLLALLALVVALLSRYRSQSESASWWGIGTYGCGMACLLVTRIAPPPLSLAAFLASSAILLPLAPLHGGYVAALKGLPGNLPAFLAFLLPSLGFHGLLALLPSLSGTTLQTLVWLALLSALYGSLKALAQSQAVPLVAYAGLAFFSILWWSVAASRTATPQATLYLSAVGFATSGLLLAWYALRARYGEADLRAIGGLAQPMPRFAALLSLLALAAMGLPPFGPFSGFLGMLLAPSLPLSGSLIVIVIVWLAASWYFLDLVQRLLFGRHRPDLPHEDLRRTEFAALLILVVILIALGLAPSRFFEPGAMPRPTHLTMESVSWSR